MSLERMMDFHRRLLDCGPRAPGSANELRAAEFIQSELRARGIEARMETFADAAHNAVDAGLEVEGAAGPLPALPLQFSVAGDVEGPLVYLGTTEKMLKDKGSIAGKIGMLFPAGGLQRRMDRCLELEKAGLLGIVAISPGMDILSTKALRFPEVGIPAATVSWRTGNRLVRLEGHRARLRVGWTDSPRAESQNVIVEKPGSGPHWLTVSAHYDSAAHAPGAMDNGGGTALLMEIVTCLRDRSFPATVRFLFSGSEENGGHDTCGAGSRAFYARRLNEIERCIAHIETDDLGNALGIPEAFYRANGRFLDVVFDRSMRDHYEITEKAYFSCDSGIAAQNNIPFVFLSDAISYPRPWYHTPEDRIELMDYEKLLAHLPHAVGMIERLAAAAPFQPWVRERGITVRPARISDLDAVGKITAAAFGPFCMARIREEFFGYPLGGKSWEQYKITDVVGGIRRNLPQAIVAEADGRVVGYATECYQPDCGIAQIGNNAVHPDFQGRGIGSLLQREVKRRMYEQGYRRFMVSTLDNDVAAQRIYEKNGYRKVRTTYHYLKGEDPGPGQNSNP